MSLDFKFMKEDVKKLFPKNLEIYTTYGTHKFIMGDFTRENSIIRICYSSDTPKENGGNVLADGDPDNFTIDIHFINDGGLKLNIDMFYGDNSVYSFVIKSPNLIKVHHYNGIGSKLDKKTHFGFDRKSLKALINSFNSLNSSFRITEKDFEFMSKDLTSYIHNESVKITPLTGDQIILVVNNNEKERTNFLDNIINYLRTRGINYKVTNNSNDMNKLKMEHKIVGIILTGSDLRINNSDYTIDKVALKRFVCPIIGICYGLQSICKLHNVDILEGDLIQNHLPLTKFKKDDILFKDIDLKHTKFSFNFHDWPSKCPNGWHPIAKLGDKIVAIKDNQKKRWGVLFHPEDLEKTYQILDNFISTCHNGQNEQEKILSGKFESIMSWKKFINKS